MLAKLERLFVSLLAVGLYAAPPSSSPVVINEFHGFTLGMTREEVIAAAEKRNFALRDGQDLLTYDKQHQAKALDVQDQSAPDNPLTLTFYFSPFTHGVMEIEMLDQDEKFVVDGATKKWGKPKRGPINPHTPFPPERIVAWYWGDLKTPHAEFFYVKMSVKPSFKVFDPVLVQQWEDATKAPPQKRPTF